MRFIFDVTLDRKRFELQMRSVRIDETGFIPHWPKWGHIAVNGTKVHEFKTNSNPNAKKRKDSTFELTSFISLGENTIEVCKSNDNEAYVVGIFLIEKNTERQLIDKYLAAPHISREMSISSITLKQGIDEEVKSESVRVSLRCPYSKMLLSNPVKGTSCNHAQCFSLEPYVYMQKISRVNRWKCPVCKKLAIALGLDELFLEIMREADKFDDPEFVEITSAGLFTILDFDGNPATARMKRLRKEEDVVLPSKRIKAAIIPQLLDNPLDAEERKQGSV
eukprot:CAMPEP_0204914694 /NCGR_PEP_ID=MMETSP1397-20131031/12596_1 /ASSEMBLY_ACC=CAM_ASM_000891 /TAXON_ID=49980 /ORGANISM="Climacostomum Climacostomum virens, Strain Stock W-24" /LENGTH=277 /DNA_ID=CAMNT_0052086399 /DNA_START=447 /DNA_END=1277 /DNA_ORIENTATION=+